MYHCTVKKFSRGKGQSATAAAAYRTGAEVVDERTGEVHDYTRRSGVVSSHIVLPDQHPEWAVDRSQLWSNVELAETRKNSVVAREVEVALPAELSSAEREKLATGFGAYLVDRYGVAAEVSIHEPSRDGDQRNHHAHILFTTRRMDETGFTEKTRELDDKKTGPEEIKAIRKDWQDFQNRALEQFGSEKRVDCRSLVEQRDDALSLAQSYLENGEQDDPESLEKSDKYAELAARLDREPTKHLGPFRMVAQRLADRAREMRMKLENLVDKLDTIWASQVLKYQLVMKTESGLVVKQQENDGHVARRIKGVLSRGKGEDGDLRREEKEKKQYNTARNIRGVISVPEDSSKKIDGQISAAERLQKVREAKNKKGVDPIGQGKSKSDDIDFER